tara:strand:+ start:307 stop:942 length:636 start_codon:yes stop_codon:yes gene_type:complete
MKTRKLRKKKMNKTKKNNNKSNFKNQSSKIIFDDYPEFTPNLTPKQIFELGSFGGTYWRPIKSKFFKKKLKNKHKKYIWLNNIDSDKLTRPFDKYDKKINRYGVKVGTTLEFWEEKGWINKKDPYGWVQWYCEFYSGRRSKDDERQISRWSKLTGSNGRFRKWLVTQILKKGTKDDWDNHDISPAIRQTLQHWGYKLTKKDFDKEYNSRNI